MKASVAWRPLLILAALRVLLHTLTNGQYGFHRDELATIDDAHHLAWGFVAYPPVTPLIARIALLFGSTPMVLRFFTALAQAAVMVIAGLMARELGGGKKAQILAALAVAAAPVSIVAGHLFQSVSFDLLWSGLLIYFVMRLLNTREERWWLAIGAVIGLGLLTRYTMAWLLAGLFAGFLLTPARTLLKSKWFAAGIMLAVFLVLPNLLWEANHSFISMDFLRSIQESDAHSGRTNDFLVKQFFVPVHLFTLPLWLTGLYFYFFRPAGRPYRVFGWAFLVTVALCAIAQGREYYTAPLYPMLLAAGVVVAEPFRWARGLTYAAVAIAVVTEIPFLLPVLPAQSSLFETVMSKNEDLREEIGWPEFVDAIAAIRTSLPGGERAATAILTRNSGEAGAINLYGPRLGLPAAIANVNSFGLRGYGNPPLQTVIVVGFPDSFVRAYFTACENKGTVTNRLGVKNEEAGQSLWICRDLKQPWPVFWPLVRSFK